MNKAKNWDVCYEDGRNFAVFSEILLERIVGVAQNNNVNLENTLDIGCGTGDLVDSLSRCIPGSFVEGIDFSHSAIKIAQERYSKLSFSVMNIESDLLDKKWGVITCSLVYAFMQDKKHFLEKVKTILHNDGIFILNSPVLFKGREYSTHEKSISVDFDETTRLLQEVYPGYVLYDESFSGKFGSRNTWLLAHSSKFSNPFIQ